MTPTIGAAWCTHFSGTLRALRHRRLRYAYRAPAFFANASASGADLQFLRFDEDFELSSLDGTHDALAQAVDVLYLSSHGTTGAAGYDAILHGTDWRPVAEGLGPDRPAVVIFDTCDLIDPTNQHWQTLWEQGTLGAAVRLVLGFASPATISQATSVRGRAFAQSLAGGDTFVDAWMNAVVPTTYQGTDTPVALGFGDSQADADAVISTASLTSMPGPRTVAVPVVSRFP